MGIVLKRGGASRILKPAIHGEHDDEPVDGMLQYPIISDTHKLFSFLMSNMNSANTSDFLKGYTTKIYWVYLGIRYTL